jgi:catechol 2,3-dioxygenase-like lactoylglutathione lyase family enzyme
MSAARVPRPLRIGSIVFNCADFTRERAFWQSALGYEPRPGSEPGDPPHRFQVLRDPAKAGPNVSIDEGEPERAPLHLDLYSEEPEADVERLLRLGATLYRAREPGQDFTVLADPEGNLFCVVDARPS